MILPPTRTAGDFKVLRESLGLPASWVASELGVLDRQVRRWEQGASDIPAAAWECLLAAYSDAAVTEQAILQRVRARPDAPLYSPRNDEELWRDLPGFKNTNLPASHYRAILARVATAQGVSLYYNPEPYLETGARNALELRGANPQKYYPAYMEGGPFDGRTLSIEFEPPHPRRPFGRLPFYSDQLGSPTYHYVLAEDSVMLSENAYDVIECRYTFAGFDH